MVACILALLLFPKSSHAAGLEQVSRPRIGVALSGGGARGMAHIGILRWFEENRIPIDFIAGTSIGGLVGGMYAMGMTPDAMADLVRDTDWGAALSGSPLYPELTFRRKQDRREFATAIEFGLRDGIQIPRGLNDGHTIGLIFDRVTLPYAGLDSFDDLPIPFRSLATDLVEGRLVVFDRGPLSEALRATMAIPGIFTPVVAGDRLYVDGGLLNNIPTDVVRGMGADIVIGVNVGSPLLNRRELDSLFGVLSQSISVMGIQNDRRNLELADIVLEPDLEPYTLMDFTDSASIIDLGYGSITDQAAALRTLSLDPDAWQRHLDRRRERQRVAIPTPRSVEIVGTNPTAARGLRRRMEGHLDSPVETRVLEDDLTRIVGNGRFASLGYQIPADGRLVVTAREKNYGPPFIAVGMDADAATNGTLDLSMGFRVTTMDTGGAGAEWRTDLKVGTQDVAATEYFRPIGQSRWFLASRAWWLGANENYFRDGNRIAELRSRQYGVGLDVGTSLDRFNELRAGYEIRGGSTSIQTGDPLFPSRKGNFRSAFVRWVYDGYDRPVIPTRGWHAQVETRWFSEEPGLVRDLVHAELAVSAFHPVSSRVSVFGTLAGGRTFRRDPLPVQQFSLGGSFRLSAWNPGEFRDGNFALGSIGYLRDLAALPPFFGDRLYTAGFYEVARLYSEPYRNAVLHDAALALGTRSPLGALWIGGAWGEGGQTKVFFRLGRVF